jgi:hypothetical protein
MAEGSLSATSDVMAIGDHAAPWQRTLLAMDALTL